MRSFMLGFAAGVASVCAVNIGFQYYWAMEAAKRGLTIREKKVDG